MNAITALADPQYGSGGALTGDSATVAFGSEQALSNIVVEWDFDNDGDFSESVEDITSFVLSMETVTGRDWPSQLTGKAGPGKLRATLRNDDDRFSYFNASSPLNAAPNSLKTGRKIRVRVSEASDPDPTPLARDRFQRDDGPLGTADLGGTWSEPMANDFRIVNNSALPVTAGDPAPTHLALLDVGTADYYAQVEVVTPGVDSETNTARDRIGLVFRYQDTSNYSMLVVTESELRLYNVVAGVETLVNSVDTEVYNGMTIGVLLSGTSVTAYLEGVPRFTATAIQTDETEVGLFGEWGTNNLRPELDDFYVWSGVPQATTGILWTGDVSTVDTSVEAGPEKYAVLEAEGWLSRLALQKAFRPSTGPVVRSLQSVSGRRTGLVVGNVFAQAQLLHPPGPVALGDVSTGAFGYEEQTCLNVARDFEETEIGFIYEMQEGPLAFADRTDRDGSVSVVTFTDATGGFFGYHRLVPLDWRREVVNRVIADLSPKAPVFADLTTRQHTFFNASNPLNVLMPTTVDSGDLLIVAISATTGFSTDPEVWVTPLGWTELTVKDSNSVTLLDDSRVYARVADGTEASTRFTFATTTETDQGAGAVHIYRFSDWYGDLSGVAIGRFGFSSSDPPICLVPWGLVPSTFLAFRFGIRSASASISNTRYPTGYTGGTSTLTTSSTPMSCAIQSARRTAVATLEDAGEFTGTFGPFSQRDTVVVAVQGSNGSSPGSGTSVQRDDVTSQDDHNAIRTHRSASQLFASTSDATAYANLILDRYAADRPILAMSFFASKSPAYRQQALERRINDRITLVANNTSGLGISQDFFIEAITHRWSNGNTLWETTWQLSPA